MKKCYMCGTTSFSNTLLFHDVLTDKVTSSRKTIYSVVFHLAKLINATLKIQPGALVCSSCYNQLSEYDTMMVKLMKAQKLLTQQLKTALESEFEASKESPIFNDTLEPEQATIDKVVSDIENENYDDTLADHSSDSIDDEQNTASRKRKKKCEICGQKFQSKYQLQTHVNENHNTQSCFICQICGAIRRNEEYLTLHMNVHEGKTENDCKYCPKRFSRPVNALRHMRAHWDKKEYQCEKCGVRFSQDHLLYNHRLRHEAEENPVVCQICNMSFKSRKTYNHHIRIHQENRPRYHCSKCPKSFTERYTLKMHMKTHLNALVINEACEDQTQLDEKVFEEINTDENDGVVSVILENDSCTFCVICNIQFQSRRELDLHLQNDHDVIFK